MTNPIEVGVDCQNLNINKIKLVAYYYVSENGIMIFKSRHTEWSRSSDNLSIKINKVDKDYIDIDLYLIMNDNSSHKYQIYHTDLNNQIIINISHDSITLNAPNVYCNQNNSIKHYNLNAYGPHVDSCYYCYITSQLVIIPK